MYAKKSRKTMNILLVSHRFYKDSKAGTETLVEDVAGELNDRGHSVFIMAVKSDLQEESIDIIKRDDGICYISIPYFHQDNIVDKWTQLELVQAKRIEEAMNMLKLEFHIVHMFHFARIGFKYFTLPCFKNSKLFLTLTDYTIFCPDYQMFDRKLECICSQPDNENNCYYCLDKQVSTSKIKKWRESNKNFVNDYAETIFTQTNSQRHYLSIMGIRENILDKSCAAYKTPPEWLDLKCNQSKSFVFGFFGRISPEKGLHILLEAFINSTFENSKLFICGSFDDNQYYNDIIKKLIKKSNKIIYTPAVSMQELGKRIMSVNCLVFPSIWNENHPVLLTYACALGIPVLCSDVPSLKELSYSQLNFVNDYKNSISWEKAMQAIKDNDSTFCVFPDNFTKVQDEFYKLIDTLEQKYFNSFKRGIEI